jgi:hypothetical protein
MRGAIALLGVCLLPHLRVVYPIAPHLAPPSFSPCTGLRTFQNATHHSTGIGYRRAVREEALNYGEVFVRAMVALGELDIEAAPEHAGVASTLEATLGQLHPRERAEWRKLAAG